MKQAEIFSLAIFRGVVFTLLIPKKTQELKLLLKYSMKEILFTRQTHDADRAGRHYDIRLVHDDKAYSWATKKELPEPGKSILLFEQPVHNRDYALSESGEIPKGQYGAGTFKLDFVRKATMQENKSAGHFVINTTQGERYLLKPVPKLGEDAWLFKNLGAEVELKKEAGIPQHLTHAFLQYEKPKTENKYLTKIAEQVEKQKKPTLLTHQIRALKKLDKENGVVLDHSTGSGKTHVFLKAIENAQRRNKKGQSLVIAPASLVSNVDEQAKELGIKLDSKRMEVLSYEKAVIDSNRLKKNNYDLVVFDEAHKLRETKTKRHAELSQVVERAKQRLLATATTKYNGVHDIAPLINIAAGQKVMPTGKKNFDEAFVHKHTEQPGILRRILGARPEISHHLKNKGYLKQTLSKYVDHYDLRQDPAAKAKFPEKVEKVIEVPMSKEQHAMYGYLENKLPWHIRIKVRLNMPLNTKDTSDLNAFSTGVRQVSNSVKPFMPSSEGITPKIKAAVDSLEKSHKSDKNFRGLVYSNYLQGGLHDYSDELKRRGIPHSVFTGKMTPKEKDRAKEEYNSGKLPVMLVSSAGAEGLDLKGTKKIQVLEPHFNKSKINQVVGRGIRYESHEHLPPKERKVEVEHYHSVFPGGIMGPSRSHSIDQYLYHNSESKNQLSEELNKLMEQ